MSIRLECRLIVLWVAAFVGCLPGFGVDDGPSSGGTAGGRAVEIHGFVLTERGPLGASVRDTVGTGTAAADPVTGAFRIVAEVSPARGVRGTRALVEFTAPGHAPFLGSVVVKEGVDRYVLDAQLVALTELAIEAGVENALVIPAPNGTIRLSLPPVSNVGARIRVAAVSAAQSPGELRDAEGDPGQALQSVGMFYVELVGADGVPLPVPNGLNFEALDSPDELPPEAEPQAVLAYRLRDDGQWQAFGDAPPREFGWWNADRNFRTACIRGRLQTGDRSCAGARVTATGPDGVSSNDNSGADGTFCITGAQTFASVLQVGGTTRSLQMPSSAGDCLAPETCLSLGDVPIGAADCDRSETPPNPPPGDCGFDCGDGTCVSPAIVCNQIPDCMSGADEDSETCGRESSCCMATQGCRSETGFACRGTCCCCPEGQACCANTADGCCQSD
jgi:hypothetical protein